MKTKNLQASLKLFEARNIIYLLCTSSVIIIIIIIIIIIETT